MNHKISRRRFLAGSLALAGGNVLAKSAWADAAQDVYRLTDAATVAQKIPFYPPALTGLRGDNDGSQNIAHSIGRRGQRYALTGKIEETYDLVIVGAGLSGLAAAYRYVKMRPQDRVLILDSHEDFGGHANRNEFTVNGKTLITYGGSESIDNPDSSYSDNAKQFLRDLGVDYKKFHQYFQQDLYAKKWGLTSGAHFNQAAFGKNVLVKEMPNKQNAKRIIAQFPISEKDKQGLIALYANPKDYWKGKSEDEREELADTVSYYDFLKNSVKLGDGALNFLKNISSDYWGHAINAVSVSEALEHGYPGLEKLKLEPEKEPHEPYIYHFPDGNASIARLMVRQLIPAVASGNTMEDIVTAKFDYNQLDNPNHSVRIRLNSTAVRIENNEHGTAVVYMTKGDTQMHQIQAKHTIYAGHSTVASHIISGMSDAQKVAMSSSVRVPMLYAKVALKNAHAWRKMGVYELYTPSAPYCLFLLDDPVNIGDYRHAETPDDPIVLHCIRIATDFSGKDNKTMYRIGRAKLAAQNEEALKKELFDHLREVYAHSGESFDDALAAVTFNRWAHGYAYEQTTLYDDDEIVEKTTALMRQPVGKIHMANTDVAWMPYLQHAVDEGYRAANEILSA